MFEDIEETRKDGEQPLHFYYNHEERIAKAPQPVKDYYAGKMKPVRGFRVLVNKQNKFVLLALVLVVAFGWVNTGVTKSRAYTQIAGINVESKAFSYEDKVYVQIQFKRSSKAKDTNPKMINATIKAIDPNKNVSDKQEQSLVYNEGEEYIRAKFTDYDIIKVEVDLVVGDEKKEISAEVKR